MDQKIKKGTIVKCWRNDDDDRYKIGFFQKEVRRYGMTLHEVADWSSGGGLIYRQHVAPLTVSDLLELSHGVKIGDRVLFESLTTAERHIGTLESVGYFTSGRDIQFGDETGRLWFKCGPVPKPVPKPVREVRVKKASELTKWFEDNEWTVDWDGDWVSPVECDLNFCPEMFQFCGKAPDTGLYNWLPEWLEEVEVDQEV